jgi:hypothetical protein
VRVTRRWAAVRQVLYTGPLHGLYNAMLRQIPESQYQAFAAGGNLFPSTIYAVASAVAKIAQDTHSPPHPPHTPAAVHKRRGDCCLLVAIEAYGLLK